MNVIHLELKSNSQSYFFGKNVYLNRRNPEIDLDIDDPELSIQTLKQIYYYGSFRTLFNISLEDLEKVHKKIACPGTAPEEDGE